MPSESFDYDQMDADMEEVSFGRAGRGLADVEPDQEESDLSDSDADDDDEESAPKKKKRRKKPLTPAEKLAKLEKAKKRLLKGFTEEEKEGSPGMREYWERLTQRLNTATKPNVPIVGLGLYRKLNPVHKQIHQRQAQNLPDPSPPTTPVYWYDLIFDPELYEMISTNTNKYARKQQATWTETTPYELEIWYGISFYMGLFRLSRTADYWT
ncbi:hypothetical protein BJ508DRAFT_366035, partial [Ascobolus immersus RN42]